MLRGKWNILTLDLVLGFSGAVNRTLEVEVGFWNQFRPQKKQIIEIYYTGLVFFFFVFVLMGWLLLPNPLRPFKIYCAPPNLGITRT